MNGKEVKIPKLGLKHHKLIRDVRSPDENLKILIDSIYPGLTAAETDLVALHLLAFNHKLKEEIIKDGFTYKLSEVYICQRLEQQYNGHTFYFRSNKPFEQFGAVDDVLKTCFIKVDESTECPDFMDMPAFVTKWADDITSTVAIPGPNGPIKGIGHIMDILNEKAK